MKKLLILSAIGLVTASLVILNLGPADAQVKKGKTRPAKTSQIMKGLVVSNCGALKKALDANPSDEKAWAQAALHAALLNEASYTLMADGRCPDKTWADAAKTLRGCSDVVLKAIADEDVDKAKSAFSAMTKSCAACHKAHKPKKK